MASAQIVTNREFAAYRRREMSIVRDLRNQGPSREWARTDSEYEIAGGKKPLTGTSFFEVLESG
jgi:hypothetical protein